MCQAGSLIRLKTFTLCRRAGAGSELIAHDLAADRLGQLVAEDDDARVFIRRGVMLDIVLDLFFERLGRLRALRQDDARFDDLTADVSFSSAAFFY